MSPDLINLIFLPKLCHSLIFIQIYILNKIIWRIKEIILFGNSFKKSWIINFFILKNLDIFPNIILIELMVSKNTRFGLKDVSLLGGLFKLWHSLGAFRNGMFSKFSRKDKSYRRLDFSWTNCSLGVVTAKSAALSCDSFKCVNGKRVKDRHTFSTNSHLRVNLFQNLHDVGRVSLSFAMNSLSGLQGNFFLAVTLFNARDDIKIAWAL